MKDLIVNVDPNLKDEIKVDVVLTIADADHWQKIKTLLTNWARSYNGIVTFTEGLEYKASARFTDSRAAAKYARDLQQQIERRTN